MNKILIDIIDDLYSFELSSKAWNIIATPLMIFAFYFWITCCDNGDFFKVVGLISSVATTILWIKKSFWGQWCLNNLFDNEE